MTLTLQHQLSTTSEACEQQQSIQPAPEFRTRQTILTTPTNSFDINDSQSISKLLKSLPQTFGDRFQRSTNEKGLFTWPQTMGQTQISYSYLQWVSGKRRSHGAITQSSLQQAGQVRLVRNFHFLYTKNNPNHFYETPSSINDSQKNYSTDPSTE